MPQTRSTGTATCSGAAYKAPDSQATAQGTRKCATSSGGTTTQAKTKKMAADTSAGGEETTQGTCKCATSSVDTNAKPAKKMKTANTSVGEASSKGKGGRKTAIRYVYSPVAS